MLNIEQLDTHAVIQCSLKNIIEISILKNIEKIYNARQDNFQNILIYFTQARKGITSTK